MDRIVIRWRAIIVVCAVLLAAFGFVIGMRSFQEKGVSPLLSIIGSIGCGVVVVGWLTLYLAGIR